MSLTFTAGGSLSNHQRVPFSNVTIGRLQEAHQWLPPEDHWHCHQQATSVYIDVSVAKEVNKSKNLIRKNLASRNGEANKNDKY